MRSNAQLRLWTMSVALCVALPNAEAAETSWSLDELRGFFDLAGQGLARSDWTEAAKGGIAVKLLPPSDPREVVVLGLTRLKTDSRCFLTQMEDIEKFKKNPAVVKVRKIGTPPGIADLALIGLTASEVAGIKVCRVGECDLKLPAEAIHRIAGEAKRDARNAHDLTEAAFRGWLADYLQAYRERGNAVLAVYQSGPVPVRVGGELQDMLEAAPSLRELVPEFYDHLADYPEARVSGVREFLYWSTEDFGVRPVTSVTHVNIFQQPGQAIIASKQIYANHYMNGSLGLTFLVESPGEGKPGMYLAYLNRSRIDLLSGWLGGVRKLFLRRRLLSGFKDSLRDVANRVDAACMSREKQ